MTASVTASILESLAANAASSFGAAKSLPPLAYHDPGMLELEAERLFRRDWICMGRMAEIPAPGDYLCRTLIDAPVMVVRQKDQSVRAFANVCLHRAARLLEGEGNARRISCPYHSWTYGLDGQLIGAPFMNETQGFDVADFRLPELVCDTWEGFIYVSLDPAPPPLGNVLAELRQLIGDYRMADYVPVHQHIETWNTNWKCLVENFMDSYHIHRVHKDSFGQYGHYEDLTYLFPGGDGFAYHFVQETEDRQTFEAHRDNTWLQGDNRFRTYLVNIFPSHVIQLQPDLLWYLSILPDGVDRLSVRWAVSIPAEVLEGAGNRQALIDEEMALIHQVNSEDRTVVENLMQTTASPHAVQGPLSCLERNLWDFGRYLARKLCNQAALD